MHIIVILTLFFCTTFCATILKRGVKTPALRPRLTPKVKHHQTNFSFESKKPPANQSELVKWKLPDLSAYSPSVHSTAFQSFPEGPYMLEEPPQATFDPPFELPNTEPSLHGSELPEDDLEKYVRQLSGQYSIAPQTHDSHPLSTESAEPPWAHPTASAARIHQTQGSPKTELNDVEAEFAASYQQMVRCGFKDKDLEEIVARQIGYFNDVFSEATSAKSSFLESAISDIAATVKESEEKKCKNFLNILERFARATLSLMKMSEEDREHPLTADEQKRLVKYSINELRKYKRL